jgi:hypothetical protein
MSHKLRSRAVSGGRFLLLLGALASCSLLAQTPPPEAPARYSTAGSLGGVTFTVTRLKRSTNGTLTLSVRLQGTTGTKVDRQALGFTENYGSSGDSPTSRDYKILDLANRKRYEMLMDSDGYCLCTRLTDHELADLSAGKFKDITIKFPAPPTDVTSVSVELPHAEPVDDVPISDQ